MGRSWGEKDGVDRVIDRRRVRAGNIRRLWPVFGSNHSPKSSIDKYHFKLFGDER